MAVAYVTPAYGPKCSGTPKRSMKDLTSSISCSGVSSDSEQAWVISSGAPNSLSVADRPDSLDLGMTSIFRDLGDSTLHQQSASSPKVGEGGVERDRRSLP